MTGKSKGPGVKAIPVSFLRSKIPGNTDEELKTKTIRKDFLKLYESDLEADKEELDRTMIAFYLLQTKGYVAYRRLVGTHGGGGGSGPMKDVRKKGGKNRVPYQHIMARKVNLDIKQHYSNYRAEKYAWPNLSLYAPRPETYGRAKSKDHDQTPFTYAFCWHGRVEFSVWHRPFMREYEMLLQEYDPETQITGKKPKGNKALGAHYWAWEKWDGKNLPDMIHKEEYTIRTDKYKDILEGKFAKGISIRNPYKKWTAPLSVKDQLDEVKPDVIKKPTTRNEYFYGDKPNEKAEEVYWVNRPNDEPRDWESVYKNKDNPEGFDHTIKETMEYSMTEPRFTFFSSVEFAGDRSIEHGHNKIHNYIGGNKKGCFKGMVATFSGTMGTLQSAFDPVFMLHHSNVERHLCGWQRKFCADSNEWKQLSRPEKKTGKRKMYPWTKPRQLERGRHFWNTRPGSKSNPDKNTGTLYEWFDAELTYVYDNYLQPPENGYTLPINSRIVRLRSRKKLTSGNYRLWYNDNPVGNQSLLGFENSDCANCQQKARVGDTIRFPLSEAFSSEQEFNKVVNKHIEAIEEKEARAKNKEREEAGKDKKNEKTNLDFKRQTLRNILKVTKNGKDISHWFDWKSAIALDPEEAVEEEEEDENKQIEEQKQYDKEHPEPEDEDADYSDSDSTDSSDQEN